LWIFLVESITTILAFRIVVPAFKKIGVVQFVREEGPRLHNYKQGTPTAGGIVFISYFVLFYAVSSAISPSPIFLQVALAAVLFGCIGFIDDLLCILKKNSDGLSPKMKLLLQFAISVVIYFVIQKGSISSPLIIPGLEGNTIDLGPFYPIFFILFISAFSNATNLADGLDGLSGGTALITALGAQFLLWGMGINDTSMLYLAGVLIGFLWFNGKPATIFMGDTGSLALGGIFATVALSTGTAIQFVFLSLIFWIEVMSVVLQISSFKLFKRKIFKMSPIHHHFELLGWDESKIVLRFWTINFLGIVIALAFVII